MPDLQVKGQRSEMSSVNIVNSRQCDQANSASYPQPDGK